MADKDKPKKSLWKRLFPGFDPTLSNDQVANLPTAAGYYEYPDANGSNEGSVTTTESDSEKKLDQLPNDRLAKYSTYKLMSDDPTIDSAIKMHLAHALSADPETGDIISIDSTSDKDNKITIDLRNTFKEIINRQCNAWAYNAAQLGIWFVRIYGGPGKGVELVRSDYYTHPRFIRMYERAGQLAGFTSAFQGIYRGQIFLVEPWKFVPFRIPYWRVDTLLEPVRIDGSSFDVTADDYRTEGIIESQNYGHSIIETCFGPWFDLQEAIFSLNMSRRNAARIERLVGVNTGKLSPQKAAYYLNTVAQRLKTSAKERETSLLRRGFVSTVLNNLIPIWGDGKGRLDISTVEGNPNIDALADIDFHVKRLGSAIGIDPALLGFGELLSGGLGDGGFFRISILAAIKANQLRWAIKDGLERLFDIHVAWKFNKAFLPGEKPWRINFNSVSSAVEREEMENREGRTNLATMIATLAQTIDPEMSDMDKLVFKNFIWTDILKIEEEKFKAMFPGRQNLPGAGDKNQGQGGDENFFESTLQRTLTDFYKGRG